MKLSKLEFTGLALAPILCALALASSLFSGAVGKSQDVFFSVSSDRESIYLGEMIHLNFRFDNKGDKPIQIPTGGVMSGNVRVYIARDGEEYREYNTSGWGRKPEKPTLLIPKESFELDDTNATILWNFRPDYSHLNADAAKEEDKLRKAIATDYAFPEAGIYFVKAVSCLIEGDKGCSIPIESQPMRIAVSEPSGEDSMVWEKLKTNPELGRFVQHGETPRVNGNVVVEQIERIIEQFTTSLYANSLRQSVSKFRTMEAKRKAALKNSQERDQ